MVGLLALQACTVAEDAGVNDTESSTPDPQSDDSTTAAQSGGGVTGGPDSSSGLGSTGGESGGQTTGGSLCVVDVCATRAPVDFEFFVGQYLIELPDGRLAFMSSDTTTNSLSIGVTDGTAEGTIFTNTGLSFGPNGPVLWQGDLVAVWNPTNDASAPAVFRSIDPVTGNSEILTPEDEVAQAEQMLVAADGIVLKTDDGVYVTDGTPAGTTRMFDTTLGESNLRAGQLYPFGDGVAFVITETGGAATIYGSTGAGGPEVLATVNEPEVGFPPAAGATAVTADGELWLHRSLGYQAHEIWRVGPNTPFAVVGAPSVAQGGSRIPYGWTLSGSNLFFAFSPPDPAVIGTRPYLSDGTSAGTVELWGPPDTSHHFNEGLNGARTLISDGAGNIWFRATHPDDGARDWLWRADRSSAEPVDLQSLGPEPDGAQAQQFGASSPLHVVDGLVYAPGYPYVIEIGETSHRRIGAAENARSELRDVHVVTHTADRVWFGDRTGLYSIERGP